MKKKLIFVVLVAMILSPASAFAAASVTLDYDRGTSEITVSGYGFDNNALIAILGAKGEAAPTFAGASFINQGVVQAGGSFSYSIPTKDLIFVGDTYTVLVGGTGLAAPIMKSIELKGISAILNTPVRTEMKLGVNNIAAEYGGTDWTIVSSNPMALKVLTPNGGAPLNGIQVEALKTGTYMLLVTAGTQTAAVMVTIIM